MSSNTSKGRGEKGSKFWMQTLVNLDEGKTLNEAIQREDASIGKIEWLSPIESKNYTELKTRRIMGLEKADLSFWPYMELLWDGVGLDEENKTIILFEAKAHTSETKSRCNASDSESILLIKNSMREAHSALTTGMLNPPVYDEDVWFNKYYQLGNRLTFLVKLRNQGYKVKLVLLNIVDDPTHKSTPESDWKDHYKKVFQKMFGQNSAPAEVICMYFDVG